MWRDILLSLIKAQDTLRLNPSSQTLMCLWKVYIAWYAPPFVCISSVKLQTTQVKTFVPLPSETTTRTIVNKVKRNTPPKQYKHQQLKTHKIRQQEQQQQQATEQENVQRMSTDPQFFESIMRSAVENKQYNKAAELWSIWESKVHFHCVILRSVVVVACMWLILVEHPAHLHDVRACYEDLLLPQQSRESTQDLRSRIPNTRHHLNNSNVQRHY